MLSWNIAWQATTTSSSIRLHHPSADTVRQTRPPSTLPDVMAVIQVALVGVMVVAAILCALKITALAVNLTWIARHGAEYREELEKLRKTSAVKSSSGIAEIRGICHGLHNGDTVFLLGVNEIALRHHLEKATQNPNSRRRDRIVPRAFLLAFDFIGIALFGGFALIWSVQHTPSPELHSAVVIIGTILVVLLLVAITVLNFEATLYHVCIGRYARSFLHAGPYLNGTEKNHVLREIGIVAGQAVATIFVGTVAIVFMWAAGHPFSAELCGAGVSGFFDSGYVIAMTFIFSVPVAPASGVAKAIVLLTSLQGSLILLLALAVMMNSIGQRP